MAFKRGRSGKAFAESLKKRAKAVGDETDLVARVALRSVEAEFRKRDFGVKKVSKQDSPSGKEMRKYKRSNTKGRCTSSGGVSVVSLEANSFYTSARSAAIKGILTYLGLIPLLFRPYLWVRDRLRKGLSGPIRLRKLKIKGHPRFAGWTARADKGSQYLRHVLNAKGEILNSLIMKPSLKAVVPDILDMWKKSTLTALRGYR